MDGEERLQKIIAEAGLASRRKAEILIAEGRVTVNGQVVVRLGAKADPKRDHIKVDGKLLKRTEPKVHYVFNKPRGVVTTLTDPEGRPTVLAQTFGAPLNGTEVELVGYSARIGTTRFTPGSDLMTSMRSGRIARAMPLTAFWAR